MAPGQFRLPGQHRWRCRPTRWCLVFCSSPRLFRCDTKLHCYLSGLGTVSQLHRDPKLPTFYRDWQKTRHQRVGPQPDDAVPARRNCLGATVFYKWNRVYEHRFLAWLQSCPWFGGRQLIKPSELVVVFIFCF